MATVAAENDIVAAPVPLTLDGTDYLVSPLEFRDYDEMDNWVRQRIISLARATLTADMTASQRDEAMRQAYETAVAASWLSNLGARISSTLDGIAEYLLLSLRHRHPDMTYAKVREMIWDQATRNALIDAWLSASNGGVGTKGAGNANPPLAQPESR